MQVALLCVQENLVDRPSMLEVSSILKNETGAINNPKKPAFSIQSDENEEEKCQLQENVFSRWCNNFSSSMPVILLTILQIFEV